MDSAYPAGVCSRFHRFRLALGPVFSAISFFVAKIETGSAWGVMEMTMSVAADPEACLHAWRETGAIEALGSLLKWQRDRACALATSILGDSSEAEDAVQQACVKLLSRQVGFESRKSFEQAVTRAVVQCSIDLLRSRRSREQRHERYAAMQPSAGIPADSLADAERDHQIREALAELPEDERIAVVLCCQDGHSVSAGAVVLEIPRETLRARLKRGLKRLHSLLAGRGVTASAASIGAALASTAQAADEGLCVALDAAIPGPACSAVAPAPLAAGLGAHVVTATASASGMAVLIQTLLGTGVLIGLGSAMYVASQKFSSPTAPAVITQQPEALSAPASIQDNQENPMKSTATLLTATLVASAVLYAEEEVAIADLPAPVVAAVTAQEGAVIEEAEMKTKKNGSVIYEVEVKIGDVEWEYEVTAEGTVKEVTQEVEVADIPQEIIAKAMEAVPGLVISEAEKSMEDDEVEWELEGTDADGNAVEVEIEIEGDEVEVEVERKGNDDDDEHEGGGKDDDEK